MGSNERRKRAYLREGILLVLGLAILGGGLYFFLTGRSSHAELQAQFESAGQAGPTLALSVAASASTRALGLMYRKDLPDNEGMLFVFRKDQEQKFWMKDTPLSLDMLFLDKNLTVVGILERVPPLSTELRSVGLPSRYVVELKGGRAAALGISKGSIMRVISGQIPSARD